MSERKIILASDDDAASIQTVTGWVSRLGHFFGNDERTARYDGSTHRKCDGCGAIIERNCYCRDCYVKKEAEKFNNMDHKEWNGTDALYSQAHDRYFFDLDELDQYCEDEETTPESLMLIICTPTYANAVSPADIYEGDLPEDGEVPSEVQAAFDELNERLTENKTILSWYPGKYAAKINEGRP
jgi:hypothetical protein